MSDRECPEAPDCQWPHAWGVAGTEWCSPNVAERRIAYPLEGEAGKAIADFLLARIAEDEERWQQARWTGLHDGSAGTAYRRAIMDCRARRQVVEKCRMHIPPEPGGYDFGDSAPDVAEAVLRALTLPYDDHPDYDQAWRP